MFLHVDCHETHPPNWHQPERILLAPSHRASEIKESSNGILNGLCVCMCVVYDHVQARTSTYLFYTLLCWTEILTLYNIIDDSNKIINVDGGYFVPAIRWMNTKLHPASVKRNGGNSESKKEVIINKFVGCNFRCCCCNSIRIYRY